VYVAWSDCRFRAGGPSTDIVLSKSATGNTWSTPTRVPIDATTSTVGHFVPGIGVDRSTSGSTARIGVAYYFYPTANCTAATWRLDVGSISSTNGGTSWSTATQAAGPMTLSRIRNTGSSSPAAASPGAGGRTIGQIRLKWTPARPSAQQVCVHVGSEIILAMPPVDPEQWEQPSGSDPQITGRLIDKHPGMRIVDRRRFRDE
jgi:hypothetical protein